MQTAWAGITADNGDVFKMFTVVIAPIAVTTITKLRLRAGAS